MTDPAKDAERIEHMARCLKDAWDNRSSYHPGPRDVATLKRVNRQLATQAERVRVTESLLRDLERAISQEQAVRTLRATPAETTDARIALDTALLAARDFLQSDRTNHE
jgi:GAF domain-containing protein